MISLLCLTILSYFFKQCSSKFVLFNPSKVSTKESLLRVVKDLNYGLKSTSQQDLEIQRLIEVLKKSKGKISEPAFAFNTAPKMGRYRNPKLAPIANGKGGYFSRNSILDGKWDLLYTNAPDVLSIGKIPGVSLKYVGQNVNILDNKITNIVIAEGWLADTVQEVLVQIKPVSPTRVELEFQEIRINFLKIFGIDASSFSPLKITFDSSKFQNDPTKASKSIPAFEIEYLDENLRVHRTAEGYTFIIQKNLEGVAVERGSGLGPLLASVVGSNTLRTVGLIAAMPFFFIIYPLLDYLFRK